MNGPVETGRRAERLVALTARAGRVRATVDRHGGGLHSLTLDGQPLVHSYDATGAVPFCAGSLLFPWPNRVRGGRWSHRGAWLQLPVNEPELGNANHGFVLDAAFAVTARDRGSVTVSTLVEPRPGYPFLVELDTTYRVEQTGVRVDHRVRNLSACPAPVALGTHPYLRVGHEPTEHLRLTVPADDHLPVDASLVPVAVESVDDAVDLRQGPVLGRRELNTCYHSLGGGRSEHRYGLAAADGRVVELWADPSFAYVQVYVTDRFPDPGGAPTRAVAVEPMTAAPDALNSGRGLRWLEPGEPWHLSWGIRAVGWRSEGAS